MKRYLLAIALLAAMFSSCGDFGGKGDTSIDCEPAPSPEVDKCPSGMVCNNETQKCNTAICNSDKDCSCGTSEGRGGTNVENCTCVIHPLRRDNVGFCKRLRESK